VILEQKAREWARGVFETIYPSIDQEGDDVAKRDLTFGQGRPIAFEDVYFDGRLFRVEQLDADAV